MLSPILACVSVSQAIDYYVEKLGFEQAWTMPPNEAGFIEFACVRLGDAEILLGITEGFVAPNALAFRGTGIQIYINLPDTLNIETLYATAQASGAVITRELQTRDWGERSYNVKDADGYNLMIAQSPPKSE
ncbi:MAG: VOC family protein [Anaerolineae bacterium]|nr:VOC family protein [Anaerolineae bacterium]